ncbi:universal stress protein [Pelagibacterium halotolerans]|uniref:universal stress protein n=1 Tax=Pelagibacterium halotolerans TaxID=531813 RepID=UPI00384FB384
MIKDICVYLDGGADDGPRIETARQIAALFDAFIAGLYVTSLPEIQAVGGYAFGAIEIDELQRDARERGDRDMKALKERFSGLDARHELRRHDVLQAHVRDVVLHEARLFDLFVTTRPYGHENPAVEVTEAVLFGSGRATLLVPPGGIETFDPGTVVIAWSNTREAARAVSEAIPFLAHAKSVSVCMVGDDSMSSVERAAQGTDIARHLDRHGVKVQLNPVPPGRGVAETLIEEAQVADADLLVMGGYGHSRLREWVLGGVTREILTHAKIPVLIAH